MNPAVKVAISLPPALLERIDRARSEEGATRSDYLRRGALSLLDSTRGADVTRYIQGYQESPESGDDVEEARIGASAALAVDPWD